MGAKIAWHRALMYGLANWALLAAGMANLGVGTWSALQNLPAIAATSLTTGVVLIFAATIDRFESLKGLGMEAKTRQLDQKIEEADEALRQVKALGTLACASLIDLNSRMGRWDSAPSPRESIEFAEKIRRILESLGADQRMIAATLRPWARVLCGDAAAVCCGKLHNEVQKHVAQREAERSAIRTPINPSDPNFVRLTAEIRLGGEFNARVNKVRQLDLDSYPHEFLRLFEEAPYLEPEKRAELLESARQLAPGMESLRESSILRDQELWIDTIEERRKNKH